MILYALVVRTKDGLPLSASTDLNSESSQNIAESKRYLKLVSNKVFNLPERCQMQLKDHSIYLISNNGVSYLALCELSYSAALSFSFLNDILSEFSNVYHNNEISQARRPYPFIGFENTIHKIRQKYNKPQGLTSRINLAELTAQLKLSPPYNISIGEVDPIKNGNCYQNLPQLGVGAPAKLIPLQWYSYICLIPAFGLIILGILRALLAFQVSSIEDYNGQSWLHSSMFLIESFIRMFQVYLLLNYTRYREAESWFCTAALFACIFILWELRSIDQHIVFLVTTLLIHVCVLTRRLKAKLPDYNV